MTVRRPRAASSAQLVQTLVYFDGPQVALLRSDRNMDVLAVHVEKDNYIHCMFACEISKSTLSKYISERFDLRYAFTYAEAGLKHYFFDWDDMDNKLVKLERATKEEVNNEDYYPEPGFFARHHTREYVAQRAVASDAIKYKIDGNWDASDFSRFYGRISDLYAIMTLTSSRLVKQFEEIDQLFVKQTIAHYLWRGGGSYVNFYDTVFSRIQSLVPLNVSKIRYASPGYIELNGGRPQLDEIENLMTIFESNYDEMKGVYNQIDRALRHDGLKKAPGDTGFFSPTREAYVKDRADWLVSHMGVSDIEALYVMCNYNTLIYAKIVLSFFRRGRDLYKFHAEGRVQTGEEAIRSVAEA